MDFKENPYIRLILASLQSRMEYRASFFIFVLTIFGFYVSQVSVISLMIYKFKKIGSWQAGELAFLYTLLIFSMGIVSSIFSGLVDFGEYVRLGNYDRILLRPLNTLGQILSSHIDLTGITHFILGVIALVITNQMINIEWNLKNITYLILVLTGSSLILGAIRIIVGAISFFAISTENLQHLVVFSSREFLLYPLNIYSKSIQYFLTFFFPIAFINFYPSYYFLKKDPSDIIHPYLIYLTLPVGIVLFSLSLYIWKYGEKYYAGTGS